MKTVLTENLMMNSVTSSMIITIKKAKTAAVGILKRPLKQALAKQRLKRREAGMVNLNRSLLRRIKHFQNSLNKTGRG